MSTFQKNLLIAAIGLLCVIAVPVTFACDKAGAPCDKCATTPEFSWNPGTKHVTPRLHRFYELGDLVKNTMRAGESVVARAQSREYLELARTYRCNWNYGNAIHDANSALGLLSLRDGKVNEAVVFLLEAGRSPGSPQLDTFGPSLKLANELLKVGETVAVKKYLSLVRDFWEHDNGQIEQWSRDIDAGNDPNFGYHLMI